MTEAPQSRTEPVIVATPRWDRPNRLNQVAAWVGIVAGVVFIVAVVFFSGFYTGENYGGRDRDDDWHRTSYPCGMMGPGGMGPGGMGPGAMTGPGQRSPTTPPLTPNTPRP